jgi:PII-like signaling protein
MRLVGEQVLLRVYLESADRTPREPTYRRVVKAARAEGLAGCTVLEGVYGLWDGEIVAGSTWGLVQHLPVIVEIVDSAEKVAGFVQAALGELMGEGLATLERAAVITYRHGEESETVMGAWPGVVRPLSTLPVIAARSNMTVHDDGILLRVFIGESDRIDGKALYEAIVQKARELGLAGATVLRGTEGFGAHSVVHKAKMLEMSSDLPIVIEIVDSQEKVQTLLPYLDSMVREGMMTMENVRVLVYREGEGESSR